MIRGILEKIQGRVPLGSKRSSKWRSVERAYLFDWPNCVGCGSDKRLEVHHVRPFHLEPELELDPGNLITLCRRCHLLFGHFDDWKKFNLSVRSNARGWFNLKRRGLAQR
jgi:5-methylcytosine-specific restriction protein A